MSNLAIGNIYDAIETLSSEAERLSWHGNSRDYQRSKDLRLIVERARPEYRALSEAMPRLRALKAEADRDYDRYVTRDREPSADGCSCHINPPCGYCTRETEDEEA